MQLLCSSSQKPLIQVVIFTIPRLDWWFQWFLHHNPWALVLISSLDVCFILQIVPWLVPGSISIFCIFLLKRTAFAICHINPIIEPVLSHLTVMLRAILGSFVLFLKKCVFSLGGFLCSSASRILESVFATCGQTCWLNPQSLIPMPRPHVKCSDAGFLLVTPWCGGIFTLDNEQFYFLTNSLNFFFRFTHGYSTPYLHCFNHLI